MLVRHRYALVPTSLCHHADGGTENSSNMIPMPKRAGPSSNASSQAPPAAPGRASRSTSPAAAAARTRVTTNLKMNGSMAAAAAISERGPSISQNSTAATASPAASAAAKPAPSEGNRPGRSAASARISCSVFMRPPAA